MPKLFYPGRVGLHQVVKCAEDQTGLRTPKIDSKHRVVNEGDTNELRLGQVPQGGKCDEWKEQSPDQMSVHIARLIVQKGQVVRIHQ